MEKHVLHGARTANWLRLIPRLLLLCWAAFWAFFIGANLIAGISTPAESEGLEGVAFATMGLILVVGITWLAF